MTPVAEDAQRVDCESVTSRVTWLRTECAGGGGAMKGVGGGVVSRTTRA
jgi:hypothetical protein